MMVRMVRAARKSSPVGRGYGSEGRWGWLFRVVSEGYVQGGGGEGE